MTAPPIEDPSERELLLFRGGAAPPIPPGLRDASVLSFAPRALELSAEELIRWIGVDLAAGVPVEIGSVTERYPARRSEVAFSARFFLVGTAPALVTDVTEREAAHRILEVLGVRGDVRVRVNVTRARSKKLAPAGVGATATHEEPEPLGNVRVWGGEPGAAERACASIHRHLRLLGLEPQPREGAAEPRFEPPAADRWVCEVPSQDARVTAALVALLEALPVEGARPRPPRRLALLEDRVKRAQGALIAYRFETHRAGTGLLHVRRREVEAGPGRPGLVRTWNLAGLAGGARVRVRDVAGRAVAEAGGSREGVQAIAKFLEARLGARV